MSDDEQRKKDDQAWVEHIRATRVNAAEAAIKLIHDRLDNGRPFTITVDSKDEIIESITNPSCQEFEIPAGPPKVIHPPRSRT